MTAVDLGPVRYEPPLTRSLPHRNDPQVLWTGPRFVRGASRWHRVRSGTLHRHGEAWLMWCGQTRFGIDKPQRTDDLPAGGLPLCGTCEGRAAGAGHTSPLAGDVDLLFRPNRLIPPRWCPGGAPNGPARVLAQQISPRVVRCGACGETVPEKRYRWHDYGTGPQAAQHEPGPGLVPGCPLHAWRHLVRTVEGVACECAGLERSS
ncbi:MAG: hypothetical protein HOV66_13565 [Streptomycetaceae bacterium]|nr:hypothetical protein [Streptomycetaceae bacterium]